jgi:hypothetical protein
MDYTEHYMGIHTTALQQIYIAYFNRPADVAGLAYWENIVTDAKGSTAAVSAAFSQSAEYKAAYAGMDAYQVVAQVYQNLFGRAPDAAGQDFWAKALINNQMTVDNVVTQVAAGALGSDLAIYNNRVTGATVFTAALNTPEAVLGYSGDKANGVAKIFIAGITDSASLLAATADAALAATIAHVIGVPPVAAPPVEDPPVADPPVGDGATYTLTAGADKLLGTAGNDVFNVLAINPTTGAPQTNLSSSDSIDGGAGKDTLNIQISGTHNSLTGTIKNVETINITADLATLVDASIFQGATMINQIGTAGAVTNLASTTTAAFRGSTIAGALSVGAAGRSVAVSFDGVSDAATLAVSGSTLNSVTVSGSRVHVGGGAVGALALDVTTAMDVTSLTVNTNQKTTLTVTDGAGSTRHVATIDASASSGAVTYDGTLQTSVVTVRTGAGDDTVTVAGVTAAATSTAAPLNSTISTGAGNDAITVKTTGTGLTIVDAGAGDDTITINKLGGAALIVTGGDGNDAVAIMGSLEATDVVDGGGGSNTVSLAGAADRFASDYTVFNKLLKNFSTIQFTGAVAEGNLDASQLAANYTTIDLNAGSTVTKLGSQALIAHGMLTATANGYSSGATTTYAGTIKVTEKATGIIDASADVLSLAVMADSAGKVGATIVGDVQSAIVTLTNTVNSTSAPTVDRIASVTIDNNPAMLNGLAGLKSITLSGNGSAMVTNAATTALTTIDASALGGTLTVAGTASTGLNYTSSNTKAETVKLGSGIDNIKMNASTYGKMDTVIGLNLVANAAGTALTAASDSFHVGWTAAFDKFATTQTDLGLALKDAAAYALANAKSNLVFTMGGDTYVFQDMGTAGSLDSADVVVKLVGTVNLDALVLALGAPVMY